MDKEHGLCAMAHKGQKPGPPWALRTGSQRCENQPESWQINKHLMGKFKTGGILQAEEMSWAKTLRDVTDQYIREIA